ncbi:MAG TPA: AAA domain-containing protein [Nitrospirales bacterium]|nr:hypothetical protein [Nitrospiraceae bacterium]HNP28028.1 AAA domain-containing protein [Nitrospirales bacterium]
MARPFFNSSIQELERQFHENNNNHKVLQTLQEELTYRKTPRAKKLADQVKNRLDLFGSPPITHEPKSQEPPPPLPQSPQPTAHSDERPPPDQPSKKVPNGSGPLRPEPPKGPTIHPPVSNRPEDILSAWTALEILSPPSFIRPEDLASGDRRRVASLGESPLPWERSERSRPNYRLYYQVVLGAIKMEPAVGLLLERYGDTRPERPSTRGKAVLAIVVVNRQGQLVDSPAVGISSFGWGVMTALKGELADLANWPSVESKLVEKIEKRLLGVMTGNEDESELRKRPLTQAVLMAAYNALVQELDLPNDWVEPPEFAIRSYTFFKDPNPPEPLLLNSFFLADLAIARTLFSEGKATPNLKRYLGVEGPHTPLDLLGAPTALAEAVSPALTPLGRWPGQGRQPLVLLQQAAVNLAFQETCTGGLLGINGPPGTGKTTLLRDLVAGIVVKRAKAMVAFNDPEKAFDHSGQKLKAGNGWIHLYRLNQSLRGFEMVVASSNNKAVENVSAELPTLAAIATDATELRYFKTLSDALHQSETWGTIAAVLGNAQNRSRFKQIFWWDDDNGLNSYLRAVGGSVQELETVDPETGKPKRRKPIIVDAESPPIGREEALKRWKEARQRFRSALEKSRQCQSWLESLHIDLNRLPALDREEADAKVKRDAALEIVRRLKGMGAKGLQVFSDIALQLPSPEDDLRKHDLAKPGFWARLFRTKSMRKWIELRNAFLEWQNVENDWEKACAENHQVKQRIADAQQKHGVVLMGPSFFDLEHGKRHQMTPWFSPDAQRLRDEVFISAMAVHRAFIDTAAKPLRHNLGALMNVFTSQTLPGPEKQALLPDLWASLFLVIPLISTTFASVNRMLGKLPLQSLGWLLVDEAGQALPQAAVGAIMRTRRAVMVGDPVQIEPVVVLPDSLTNAICRCFGIDPDHYGAPSASVQTRGDAASTYASEFQTRTGSRSVGVPLLVHRRCSEPMFSISNSIAYSGLMVSAKSPKPSPIQDVLGSSKWIHIEGNGEGHWCQKEGEEVFRLLRQLKDAGVIPDLYIITPFVNVADHLRRGLHDSKLMSGWVEQDSWQWTNERIGTIHTAQGREAEAVILVLGAPHPTQTGARSWAGGRPNLLNVAVTRAKEVIYVIGNRQLWREAGLFQELDKRFP